MTPARWSRSCADKHHARVAQFVWAAEETGAREILTTDHDFEIYRTRTQERLELVLQL